MAELDRKTYVGGSDIAAIMGLAPSYGGDRGTPVSVWQQKLGEVTGQMDAEKRLFLDRRKRWEPVVRQMLTEEFDARITAFNNRYVDPAVPYFAAEVDFEWLDPVSETTENGEIKTVSPRAFGERFGWGEPGTDQVPIHYAAQCMWGLMVTGRRRCVLAAMVGLDDMLFYPIERDEETITAMREAALVFWNEHVLAKRPPEPQTFMDVQRLMARSKERPVQLSAEAHARLRQLEALRASIAAREEEAELLALELGAFVCKAWDVANPYVLPEAWKLDKKTKQLVPDTLEPAGLYYDGARVGTWKKQARSFIDQKTLKAELPEVAERFMKTTESRVLRFVKPK